MQRHDYAGADGLRAMQGLVQRIWSPRCRWHVGDLVWGRCAIPGAAADFRTALWFDGDQAVGWGWAEVPGYLSWVVDPAMPEVAAEVLSWFEGVAESAELTTTRARGLPPPSDGWTITTRSACWSLSGVPRRTGVSG